MALWPSFQNVQRTIRRLPNARAEMAMFIEAHSSTRQREVAYSHSPQWRRTFTNLN
jgi:hypothetical protein